MKQRNHAFDLLCGLCILRMIMLHSISMCGLRGTFWFGKLMAWTFFFLCFFFFKAGYFNKTVSGPTLPFVMDKARRLLIPYATWGVIASVFYFGFMYFFPQELHFYADQFRWDHVWKQSHFYGDPPLWFLFSFFWMYVAVHLMQKVPRLSCVALAFPLVSWWLAAEKHALWMSMSNVFMGVFFFYLGHWWHWLQDRLRTEHFVALSAVLVAVFAIGNHYWHGEYDMSLNHWVQRPWGAMLNTVSALCGLSGLLLVGLKRRIPGICYIGEHSMVYFVAHYPLLFYYCFVHLAGNRSMYHHWDDFILSTVIVLCICSWLVPYVERVPWLSGRIANKGRTVA